MRVIYKPKYVVLNLILAIILYATFLYTAYLQGGNRIIILCLSLHIYH
jgi:hypothetical protein